MKGSKPVIIRQLDADDVEEALTWRMEVLEDVFAQDGPWLRDEMRAENEKYLQRRLGSELVYCIAAIDGEDVGCGAFCLQDELPSPDNPSAKSAYLMNIYTRASARGRGIGHAVVSWLIEQAKESGAGKIYLEATAVGCPLYESLGFAPMDGMMKLDVTM